MSDLAPFVAAALRDKIVMELMAENEKLRQQLDEVIAQVRITGRKGYPIYAQGRLTSDTPKVETERFQTNRVVMTPIILPDGKDRTPKSILDSILNVELWVGGKHYATVECAHEFLAPRKVKNGLYLRFSCRWMKNIYSFKEMAFEVGPYESPEVCEEQRQLCLSLSDTHENAYMGLTLVPGIHFPCVYITEPSYR